MTTGDIVKPIKTGKIEKVKQAVELATDAKRAGFWYRGEPREYDEPLTPVVFRSEWRARGLALAKDLEQFFFHEFKRKAPAMITAPPNQKNNFKWLLLMRHHGTPTRLLDWSENFLVALYFAVRDYREETGIVWAMRAAGLNLSGCDKHKVLDERDYIVQTLVAEAAGGQLKLEQKQKLELLNYPPAFKPTIHYPRMRAQYGAFTIHRQNIGYKQINELLPSPREWYRWTIDPDVKPVIESQLAAMGITEDRLFPELDGLSESLQREVRLKEQFASKAEVYARPG